MAPPAEMPTGVLEIDAVDTADERAAAAALNEVQDALGRAGAGPLLMVGGSAGFVLGGPARSRELRVELARTCDLLSAHPQPVIAAVAGGSLLDAGLELALSCDLLFTARGVRVGLPSAGEGWPTVGAGQRLARTAGTSLATRMLLLGEIATCGEDPALDRALSVVSDPELAGRAALERIRDSAPLAVEALKVALRAADETGLTAGLEIEADLASLLLPTRDRAEGIEATLTRRAPIYRGE